MARAEGKGGVREKILVVYTELPHSIKCAYYWIRSRGGEAEKKNHRIRKKKCENL